MNKNLELKIKYFSSETCSSCPKVETLLEELRKKHKFKLLKFKREDDLDINEFNRLTIMQLPTVIFPDGERFVGARRRDAYERKIMELMNERNN